MNIDEIITVEEYNPQWPVLYELERKQLANSLHDFIVDTEHIGSTSVIGMKAKPIIDIMIGVTSLNLSDESIRSINEFGYDYFGEIGPGRIYCRKRSESNYNLAIVIHEDALWNNNILFREYLKRNPDEAFKYSELKNKTLLSGINTLLKYSAEKTELIIELMRKAKE